MPIAVEIEFADGLRRSDYESVLQGLGLDEDPPQGLLAHIATERNGQIRVLEVWESSRQYRSYRERRLLPNIEYALGAKRAARTRDSVRTRLPVRGFVAPRAGARPRTELDPVHLEHVGA